MSDSLFDLANRIGFDAIDREISVWIEMGEFDTAVAQRAAKLGWISPKTLISELDEPLGIFE